MYKQTIGDLECHDNLRPLQRHALVCKKILNNLTSPELVRNERVLLDAINSPGATQGFRTHELSKYTTKELKDELARRKGLVWDTVTVALISGYEGDEYGHEDLMDVPEQYDVCKHNMEVGYCEVSGCAGSY